MMSEAFYKAMLDDFERRFVFESNPVVMWEPISDYEILVTLKDGMKFVYNNVTQAAQNMSIRERPGYVMKDDVIRREFGRRLYIHMKLAGMIQEDLADAAGISTVSISNYLNGYSSPTVVTAYKLAHALGVELRELINF